MSSWTLFSNHGHVLVCLARDSEARLRDVAADVGITERAVQKIVRDLQDGGMISITKNGRRNRYRIHKKQALRHKLEANCKLRDLLKVVNKDPQQKVATPKPVQKDQVLVSDKPEGKLESIKTKPLKPGPVKTRPVKTRPDKAEPAEKTESADSKPSDSIERQQGSLF